jgi:hypothetical protein
VGDLAGEALWTTSGRPAGGQILFSDIVKMLQYKKDLELPFELGAVSRKTTIVCAPVLQDFGPVIRQRNRRGPLAGEATAL